MSQKKKQRLEYGLDSDQHRAVHSRAQRLLVVAGAGSGKTRVFVHRIARLVADGADPASILALSFTREAAGEVAARLESMGVHGVDATTIHAWCHRVPLREHGHLVGRGSYQILSAEGAEDVLRNDLGLGEFTAARVHGEIGWTKNTAWDSQGPALAEQYDQVLAERSQLDFDDLQVYTLRLLTEHPEVLAAYRARYTHVLIDEYQDVNPVQHAILGLLVAPAGQGVPTPSFAAVGDPRQAIFAFRGASPDYILGFADEFDDAEVVQLRCNYRSTSLIVRSADAVVGSAAGVLAKPMFTRLGEGLPVQVLHAADPHEEASLVVQQVVAALGRGEQPVDVAVLYRFHAQAELIVHALLTLRIPVQVEGPDASLRHFSAPHGVRLRTVHAAKGLEYDTVVLPGWCEGTVPSFRATSREELSEEHRIAYVALTRARRRAVVVVPATKQGRNGLWKVRPSRFIEQVERVGATARQKVGA